MRLSDEDYERSFNGFLASIESILKQCDEVSGAVRNATELIVDCREGLSRTLKAYDDHVAETERKMYGRAHRLEQEYAERFPEEE